MLLLNIPSCNVANLGITDFNIVQKEYAQKIHILR